MAEAAVARPWIAAREPRREGYGKAKGQPSVSNIEGCHAPVTVGSRRAEYSGARPRYHRVPTKRTGRVDRTDK